MDFLELNIHQRILSDIAANAASGDKNDIEFANNLITTKVNEEEDFREETKHESSEGAERIFMSTSRAQCSIAFGELVASFPESEISRNVDTLLASLIEVLNDISANDFDKCISWQDWALPDQLVYSTAAALLRISSLHPDQSGKAIDAICNFLHESIENAEQRTPLEVLTQVIPALHGLYRAISSTTFKWTFPQWNRLVGKLEELCSPGVIDRLNNLLTEILQADGADSDLLRYVQTFVARYVSQGRPLSGYFIVCCVIETQWTVLAQALAPVQTVFKVVTEAAAANRAWLSLMRDAPENIETFDEETAATLARTAKSALQTFTDLLEQLEEMDSEPSLDTYAWETMSESLKLASVCSVALQELDGKLFSRLQLLLSETSPVTDNLVQEAALKATTVLVQSFPEIAPRMIAHLRRFVTSPLPIFELEFAAETRAPPPLAAAAKCLALCIRIAPGDDLILSNMYSLLNYIAATSKETYGTSIIEHGSDSDDEDEYSSRQLESGLRGMSEDERRLVGISTISVVTKLALEFKMEEVTRLTISMLLQRLRTAEPTVEAAIAYNLIDLALSAPENAFADIIRVFSAINRTANPDDPRFSNNMILAAQTRLARELHRRPDLYEIYLIELLSLFVDKGVAIQNLKISNHHVKIDDMVEQLASLLLAVDALLAHNDFNPHMNASPALISLFRNMWFLCVLFHLTSPEMKDNSAMSWLRPALSHIASKTPSIILEDAQDAVTSDVEYNSAIRQEYAQTVVSKHRATLLRHISLRASDIRSLSSGQVIFILTMHDVEAMRSASGLVSSLAVYFMNDSINRHPSLSACMESVAEKIMRGCVGDLNAQAAQQTMPKVLSAELRSLLVYSTHRIAKARDIATKYLNRLITSFPSLMCDTPLVFAILEVLTLLRRASEDEYTDEYNPAYEYYSERTGLTLQLTDNYRTRNEILGQIQRHASGWFDLALGRAPIELQSTLQKYLALSQSSSSMQTSELGASIAEQYGKAIGPVQRQLRSLSSLSKRQTDGAKSLAGQLAVKSYFSGESAGMKLSTPAGYADKAEQSHTVNILKQQISDAVEAIHDKKRTPSAQELKRLLFRCAAALLSVDECDYELLHYIVVFPFEISTPSAVAASIDVWSWIITERPKLEVALISELLTAWTDTIKHERGIFSRTLNYDDPFYHPIKYSPTDKDVIDRGTATARRTLTSHALILQLLLSRLQAARYRRPEMMFLMQRLVLHSARAHGHMSTHALAREVRFSFLMFGFETLKSSCLDSYSESIMRDQLYSVALAWFSTRPQWSYGPNRVQVDADIHILSEFLSYLQHDVIRGAPEVSSLSPAQLPSRTSYYLNKMKSVNLAVRLLAENEIFRLTIWDNPTNDPKRSTDPFGTTASALTDTLWQELLRSLWSIDPAIVIHLTERFNNPAIRTEAKKLVRSSPVNVLDVPEALSLLLGDKLDSLIRRDLKHLLLWAPVPPVVATSFFEPRYRNDPLILQYAHRVLEQHPVDLTFFFVPQVVQALRYDDAGYVSRFIFETAKISQLFCHQIIWNMKANCYKDDLAQEACHLEDAMKPVLDSMTDRVVKSLSGDARDFYNREFTFFNEVTSISGKLKPYIKKTKPEKKAKIDEEMAKIVVDVGVYLPSNPDGKVVDIDKKSGRPLQSHAKAPFMATFKVRKERPVAVDMDAIENDTVVERREEYDVWQAAIFKVGDDCRQDVLALQVIAMFKNIFESVGLTLYLFPYRVTATGPGCGVIDVVPNATSRDEMGRAKVNDLLDFFTGKYGGQDSVAFQKARLNFIQSMAAYSVACYILQIKDRHNGNIMIDGEGHIVHIDFGFLFDIDKFVFSVQCFSRLTLILCDYVQDDLQGVKFEPSSFKLNHEMVVLMGGRYSQGYQLFQNLTVKAFLAIRPHAEQLISTVQLMLDTSLPSFKGEPTIKRLRDRFALHLNERQAADFMMGVVKNAHENVRSTAYDEFQRLQNGIPYK